MHNKGVEIMGKSIAEIEEIRKSKRAELDLRVNTAAVTREKHILVCHGTGCTSSKSPKILEKFNLPPLQIEKLLNEPKLTKAVNKIKEQELKAEKKND